MYTCKMLAQKFVLVSNNNSFSISNYTNNPTMGTTYSFTCTSILQTTTQSAHNQVTVFSLRVTLCECQCLMRMAELIYRIPGGGGVGEAMQQWRHKVNIRVNTVVSSA
jgi:hypothetical protein